MLDFIDFDNFKKTILAFKKTGQGEGETATVSINEESKTTDFGLAEEALTFWNLHKEDLSDKNLGWKKKSSMTDTKLGLKLDIHAKP